MERQEISTACDGSSEQPEARDWEQGGIRLDELIELKDSKIDKKAFDLLKLMLKQHKELAHIEVVLVSPEETPDTGGFFQSDTS